jgi:hypothetical protein
LGRGRCPRAELRSAPGRLWASTGRHYERSVGCIDWTGTGGAGNARTNCVRFCRRKAEQQTGAPATSQEAWPEAARQGRKSLAESRKWNADRRARPQRRAAQAGLSVARPAPAGADTKHCVCRRSASFIFLSSCLPAATKRLANDGGVAEPNTFGALCLTGTRVRRDDPP